MIEAVRAGTTAWLWLDETPVHVLVSHVADAFGVIELQVLDREHIEFITLTVEEFKGSQMDVHTFDDAALELSEATKQARDEVIEALGIGMLLDWMAKLMKRDGTDL